MTLDEFIISSGPRNVWLQEGPLKVYVRHPGLHWVNGEMLKTFDLASVEVEESHRGQGHFKRLLERLEDHVALAEPIYIENVLPKRFRYFFRKRGYLELPCTSGLPEAPPCFLHTRRDISHDRTH